MKNEIAHVPTSDLKEKVFEVWPSDLLTLFKRAGLARKALPKFEPGCELAKRELPGREPVFTSPRPEMSYLYRFGATATTGEEKNLPLSAVVDGDVSELHWFVNGEYVGRSAQGKNLLWGIKPGHFVVRVVDDHGRSTSRPFDVEVVN